MHKQFSELAMLDDDRNVVDRQRRYHQHRQTLEQYFAGLPGPATVTLEATRNWYWPY